MNKFLKAAVIAVSMITASTASASVVVLGSGAVPASATPKVTAASISAGQFVAATEILQPTETAQFVFTALEDLFVGTIALSASGSNHGLDLAAVKFGFSDPASVGFSAITVFGAGAASAVGSLNGFFMNSGDTFTIFSTSGNTNQVGLTASFSTTAVPVPAALPLMVGALGLLGVARTRKSRRT